MSREERRLWITGGDTPAIARLRRRVTDAQIEHAKARRALLAALEVCEASRARLALALTDLDRERDAR
jgi:hypothetical protein